MRERLTKAPDTFIEAHKASDFQAAQTLCDLGTCGNAYSMVFIPHPVYTVITRFTLGNVVF